MVRNLTKTLATVSLLIPASAYSLGIGDIKLHSALNQELDAEISLLVSADENISDIKVRLAPPEKFDEAGIPWNYFLSRIKFEQVTRADGSTIVKLTSNEVLREPFLDFLLEVIWDKGNLYREFTVLIDPPATYTQPVVPVIQKASQIIPEPKSESRVATTRHTSGVVEDIPVVGDSYGPTDNTDSVWKIAEKTNHYQDVSIEQMMMAIYKVNPQAFYKDNVNALMAGQTLKIPEKELILKLSQKQALRVFKQQDNAWSGHVTARVDKRPAISDKLTVNTQLELEAPVEEAIAATVKVVSENDVTMEATAEPDKAALTVSLDEQGLALQARMEKLEQQLLMMQKMLVLKNEQIAVLQNKAQLPVVNTEITKKTVVAEEGSKAKSGKVASEVKSTVEADKKAVKKEKIKPKTVTQPEPASELITDSLAWTVGGMGIGILGVLGWFWWRSRKAEEESETESMFAYASEISLPESSLDAVSSPTAELDISSTAVVEDESTSYDVGTVGESSFLSEFTPSDFDAFDTGQNEVDPISEADVYLAYGRYQQAEELMRQAIIDQPDRDECKLKLLEIFYANENTSAFEAYAAELVSAGKNTDHVFWLKVVDMGRELVPESSLFSETDIDKVIFESKALSIEDTNDAPVNDDAEGNSHSEMNFDLSVFDEDNELDLGSAVEVNDEGLDFDLSVFELDESKAEKTEGIEETAIDDEALETVDFDLNAVAFDGISEPEASSDKDSLGDIDEIESFDFDLPELSEIEQTDKVSEQAILGADAGSSESLESFDFSLDDTLPETDGVSLESNEQAIEETDGLGEGDFDFDFDFDLDTSESVSEPVADLDDSVLDLTDMDELETKIDLAKAYIDMEDFDAARDIAEEVLEKGSPEQKEVAQGIIEQLT